MKASSNGYTLFIDESGVGNLNHLGKTFILSTILVKNEDIPVIQGYLRMLKQNYFTNDNINIHCTDLFERTYQCYRQLIRPIDKRNAFITRIIETSRTISFRSGIYYVDKNKLRLNLNYKPYPGKKSSINPDLPYEIASRQAILDFVEFLKIKKTTGEIVIESRQFNDKLFVGYFDDARKSLTPGNIKNPFAQAARERINSLSIANKDYIHAGLELADISAYCAYRKFEGDPKLRMKIAMEFSNGLHSLFKDKTYIRMSTSGYKVIEVTQANLSIVKPSKQV